MRLAVSGSLGYDTLGVSTSKPDASKGVQQTDTAECKEAQSAHGADEAFSVT